MPLDPHPRYVVLEQKLAGVMTATGSAPGATVFCILDRWYCWQETFYARTNGVDWYRHLPVLRRRVRRLAAEWNAEHDTWLAEAP